MRKLRLDEIPLAFTQIGADLQNGIVGRQPSERFETGERVDGETAATGAHLQDRSTVQLIEDLEALLRDASTEQAGNLRSGGKVAAAAEFAGPGAVIAQTRCV